MIEIADMKERDFPGFCHEHGLKCTAQRMAVFSALRGDRAHPSVDNIWENTKKRIPTITRDSVYRILNEFAEFGLISRLDALSAARYDTWTSPHAHFVCERCGAITDYPLPRGIELPEDMPEVRHHLELRVTGLCEKCRKAERKSFLPKK